MGLVKSAETLCNFTPYLMSNVLLNMALKEAIQKTSHVHFEVQFSLDTRAKLCLSNTQRWKVVKLYLLHFQNKKDKREKRILWNSDIKLGIANSHLFSH